MYVAADAMHLESAPDAGRKTDFSLAPTEVEKGERAASAYIGTLKTGESQKAAEEALDTLAAVISGGICERNSFPWHQVQSYHGALAFSILKEKGAPAHIEAMRCRADHTRKYQPVPETYPTKQVQKIRSSFKGVMGQCSTLGFLSDEDAQLMVSGPDALAAKAAQGSKGAKQERTLVESEVLALKAACHLESSPKGPRDSLLLSLAFYGTLKTVDLIGLTMDHLKFDSRSGRAGILYKPAQAKRSKRISLSNDDLIALEDWLEARGREDGPLFCAVGRAEKIERKRMTAANVREICEQRASEAGVVAFAPNDLARSQASASSSKKRAAGDNGDDESGLVESALFASDREFAPVEAKGISFPYHVRIPK